MSLHFTQYEIYSNLKYFAESRDIEMEFSSIYPDKITKPLTCDDVITMFNTQKYIISSFKLKNNTKTYTIIYGHHKNYKVLSNDIQLMINKIPETKLIKRQYNVDINLIIKREYIKSNIINKLNNLKIKEHPFVDITYHGYDMFLLGNIKESNMYVKTKKLNDVEKEEELQNMSPYVPAIMKSDDPLTKYCGYRTGDMIRVTFPNIEMGLEVEYRYIS